MIIKNNKKLLLLLVVFILNIILQATLNYSFKQITTDLDKQNKQLENISILGENIVRDLLDIQARFYQIPTSTNVKQRELLQNQIQEEIIEIKDYLNVLKIGGSFNKDLQTNLTSHEIINTTHTYNKTSNNIFDLTYIDIIPKLDLITQKTKELIDKVNHFSTLNNPTPQIKEIRNFIKSTEPLFVRTIENANSINYEYTIKKQELNETTKKQKELYAILQIALTILIIILAIIGFYIVGRQIQKNQQELEERREYVHDILASQSNIIIVNDGEKMLDVSGGFFNLFPEYSTVEAFQQDYACICDTFVQENGYLQREINGKRWVDYVSENPNMTHKAKIIRNNKIHIFQAQCIKSEKYGRYIISMFDVTHLEKLLTALEIQKNKALKATKSKSEFLANMSHEIRTPLNAILGFITLLQDKNLDAEGKKYLKTIASSGQTLLAIINDVLDFSKIESGKLIIDEITFNAREELSTVAELFNSQCLEKHIKLHINLDNNLPPQLKADILRIKQIITNLLSNAVKFSDKNTNIYYTVKMQNNNLCCTIKDEGIGIDKDRQKIIFEAFSQADISTTRKFGGTGLGLNISAKLVNLLGGEIQLKSELNKGSEFSFQIPVNIVKNSIQKNNTKEHNNFSGCILLVEDNLTNQMLMKAILGKQGINYEIAADGDIAVEKFKQSNYDLVLMDENMPKMQGTQATKLIRQYEAENNLKRTPIVALTASTIVSERDRFYDAGMDDYLSKPIEIPRLIEVFTKFLKQ
jgi:signal transduction histidine kinase/CheY-like chemotaxis protein/cell division protein FtsB